MTTPTKDRRPDLSTARQRVYGLIMLVVILLIPTFCIANFNKVFKPSDRVTLQASTVGNQLQKQSDVKIRGIIVGEVHSVESDGQKATLQLDIDPSAISTIPSDTRATLIPKTLFGERYVSLSTPPNDRARPLQEGDIITEDRTQNSTETTTVLDNMLPVLSAVQPQKLSDTLGAISSALSGRGKELGDTLVALNQYLEGMNPALPDFTADIRTLPAFADLYNQASPDLIAALDNFVTTSRTLVEQRAAFESTFRSVTSASNTTTDFLATNRDNLIQLAATSRPVLGLVAEYSPELPCLLQQLTDLTPKINAVLDPATGIQIDLEINRNRGKYVPSDAPQYADRRGPRCYSVQGQAPQDPPGGPLRDGASHPSAAQAPATSYPNLPSVLTSGTPAGQTPAPSGPALTAPTGPTSAPTVPTSGPSAVPGTTPQSASGRIDPANLGVTDTPNSPEERQLVTEVTAVQMGLAPAQVPAFAPYLTAATLRGVPVSVGVR